VLVLMAGAALAQGGPPPGGPPPGGMMPGMMGGPAEVGTITLVETDIPVTRSLPGRAVAYERTEIRPRVSGTIEEILFTPGRPIGVGDPLFRIDDAPYRAEVASASAQLASAEAGLALARANVERYRSLQGSAATMADLQSAEATAAAAEATLANARVALELAQLDLDRTTIRSPISGIVAVPQVSVGALVTANQSDSLTSVTRLDPIYVDISDSSAGMLRNRQRLESGELSPGDRIGLELILETGEPYAREGALVAQATEVSSSTGTIDMRVSFANPDHIIMPGQFLRVNVTLGTTRAILVPQRATSRSADGSLVAWVVRDGTARRVTLTTAGSHANSWIVTGGVEPGAELAVDGLGNLVDGAEIRTVPVEIDASGVVRDLAAPGSAGGEPGPAAGLPAAGGAMPADNPAGND